MKCLEVLRDIDTAVNEVWLAKNDEDLVRWLLCLDPEVLHEDIKEEVKQVQKYFWNGLKNRKNMDISGLCNVGRFEEVFCNNSKFKGKGCIFKGLGNTCDFK